MPSRLMTLVLDAIVDILVCFSEAGGGDVLVGDFVRGGHFHSGFERRAFVE
jgi:hypothetical protein